MRIQLAWTLLGELAVMACGVVLLKLAASILGPAGFGEYALTRRAVGLLYLPLLMGLGVAVPRYIAIARTGAAGGYSEGVFATAAIAIGVIPSMAVVILLNLAPARGAMMIFGSDSLTHLVRPATIALAGMALHAMIYAVYRGRTEMGFANLLQVVNIGLIPVSAFALGERDAASVLTATGTGWVATSFIGFIHLYYNRSLAWRGRESMQRHLSVLLRFGIPRVPGEFAVVGLFAIPSLMVVRTHGVVAAGQFSAALSLVAIVASAFTPVSLVLLPHASALAANGEFDGLRRLVLKILAAGVGLATATVVVGATVMPSFIQWYFGPSFESAIPIFRTCLIGAIPFVVYVLLRSILDALDVKALNSRNLFITLTAIVSVCWISSSILWMAAGLVASLALLGALTLRDTYNLLRIPSFPAESPVPT